MEGITERLRASKRQAGSEKFRNGHEVGQGWAKRREDTIELQRLDQLYAERTNDSFCTWEAFFSDSGSSAYSNAEILYFALCPEHENDRGAAADFWEREIADGEADLLGDGEWFRGFAEGALDFWWEVKGRL